MLTGNFLLVEDASRTKRQITCGYAKLGLTNLMWLPPGTRTPAVDP